MHDIRIKKKKDLIAAHSLLRDPISHIDCHSSKIVHLVSTRDHVTSNSDENYKSTVDEQALKSCMIHI